MSRTGMTSEQLAAIDAATVRPIAMVRAEFDSGVMAWHSGYGDIDFDGHTYTGTGKLGGISSIKEQPGTQATSLEVTISGLDPEIVALIQTEPYINRKVYLHVNLLDDQDRPVSAAPILFFKGTIDDISAQFGNTAAIKLTVKSRLADWERKRTLRYTDADQQRLYPGDKGMEFIPQMSERKLIWPLAKFFPDPRD